MTSNSEDRELYTVVTDLDELEESAREQILELADGETVRAVADSDLLESGRYGHVRLILLKSRILILENGSLAREVDLGPIISVQCRDFVGNGLLEAYQEDGERLQLLRYSKTRAQPFNELSDRINRQLQASSEELEAQQDRIAKVTGSREERTMYRCPNCGHPLKHSSDACPKCTSTKQVMWRLCVMMKHHWKLAVGAMVLSVLFTGMSLAPGLLVRNLVDKALRPADEAYARVAGEEAPGQQAEPTAESVAETASPDAQGLREELSTRRRYLWGIVGLFAAVVVLRAGASHYQIRLMGTLGERVVADLRSQLYRNLQRLSLSYYDREHTGRIMARVLSDTRIIQRFTVRGLQQITVNLLTVTGISIGLVMINWWLAAIALLPVPVVVLCARHFSGRFHSVFLSVRRKYANLSANVSETISGMRVVKSFGQEDREIVGFDEKNTDVYNARISAVGAKSRFTPAVGLLVSMGTVAVWLVGGENLLRGGITLGTLWLFIIWTGQFYRPVRMLMNLTESFQESATAAERIFNVMDMPSEVSDHESAVDPRPIDGRIEVRNVSFGYNEGERVLKNIDLTIEPGQMIGLVGQTGSGKSTLVSLIARFYDPNTGEILLDGKDLRDIRTKALRESVGMVLQDPFLFVGTIRENIAYGREDATDAEILEAAKAANAHEFIMNLPDAYDSDVGERGVKLSGGEKQRVSIARAILKDPKILILDEATSAVDTATEAIIQDAMDRLVHGRTTIAIAHRLSTLRNADRLVVMDQGEIAEEGTHEELIAADGLYADLCRIQAEFASTVNQ